MKKVILSILLVLLMSFGAYAQVYQTDLILTKPDAVWVDSRSYNGLSSLLTAIGSDETTIYIAQQEDFTGTIPDNVRLKFLTGGSINATGPVTINAKSIDAPNVRIFYGSGAYDFASGSKLKSAWFEDFDEAIDETSDDEITLIISKSETASTSASIGNDVVLRWDSPGNELTISSGVVISNVDKIIAGDYQIVSGDGRFDFNDGVVLRSTWFSALNEAGRHIDDTVATLEVRDTEAISYDYTFGSNVTLHFYDSISIDAGKTVTIYSPANVVAQPIQIFDGSGSVSFTRGGIAQAEWWGLVDDASTDNTDAIEAACASLPIGSTLKFAGTENGYEIADCEIPLAINIVGTGRAVAQTAGHYNPQGTTFTVSSGNSGFIVLTAAGHGYNLFKDIRIVGEAGAEIGIDICWADVHTDNVSIFNFLDGIGMKLDDVIKGNHNALHFQRCGLALYLAGDSDAGSRVSVFNNLVIENGTAGIYSEQGNYALVFNAPLLEILEKGQDGTSFPDTSFFTADATMMSDLGFATQTDIEGGIFCIAGELWQLNGLYMEKVSSNMIYAGNGTNLQINSSYLHDQSATTRPRNFINGKHARVVSLLNSSIITNNARGTALFDLNTSSRNHIFLGNSLIGEGGAAYTGTVWEDTLNGTVYFGRGTMLQENSSPIRGLWVDNIRYTSQTVTSSSNNIDIDLLDGAVVYVNLSENTTITTSNEDKLFDGQILEVHIIQDGTGGWTVSWNAKFSVTWSDTGNTANKISSILFRYRQASNHWIQVSAQVPYHTF